MAGVDAGGIGGVVALLTEHGDAIEADLARVYGVHVGDFPTRLTARRLRVLVTNLGPDAAYWRSVKEAGLPTQDAPSRDPERTARSIARLESRTGHTIPDEIKAVMTQWPV